MNSTPTRPSTISGQPHANDGNAGSHAPVTARRRPYLQLALMSAGLFLVGTNAFLIPGLMPAIAEGLGTTDTAVAYSVTVYALVIAVAAPACSILLARVSRRLLMTTGLLVMAVATLITAVAPTVDVFTAGRALAAIGGALLVPTATASGPALLPARSATAIAIVTLGFSLAIAIGSPVGAAVGAAFGWRVPFIGIGVAGILVAVAIGVAVRRVPLPPPASFGQRLRPLRNPRIVAGLTAGVLLMVGFNAVYLHVAAITAAGVQDNAALLSLLLLIVGGFGVAGTAAAGPLVDRFGARWVVLVVAVVQVAALAVMTPASPWFWAEALVFAVWGLTVFSGPVAVQDRLVATDPEVSALTLSWYSSVQYLGLALAPVVATVAIDTTGVGGLPLWGAAAVALAALIFLTAFRRSRR